MYLTSLVNLDTSNFEVHYYFIDDNTDEDSKEILKKFSMFEKNVEIKEFGTSEIRNINVIHGGSQTNIDKVTGFRNHLLKVAREGGYDYLFTVDSDLLLQKKTLSHLVSLKKDIISEIFWTKWSEDGVKLPQVWECDKYSFFDPTAVEGNLTE